MPKLPVVKPKEIIKALKKIGFSTDHVSGSHYIMYNQDKTLRASVPYHNKPLKRKTLKNILENAGLSVEELKTLL